MSSLKLTIILNKYDSDYYLSGLIFMERLSAHIIRGPGDQYLVSAKQQPLRRHSLSGGCTSSKRVWIYCFMLNTSLRNRKPQTANLI